MNKLLTIAVATLFLLTIPTLSLAFETDNNWNYLVVHSDTNTREYTNHWYDLAYDDNWWQPITGDGTKPIYTSGSVAVLFRKTINWNNEDLWFRTWDGYAGTCYINQVKVDSRYIHLSDYFKPGNNLIACSIWGAGKSYWENRQAYFYGQFKPVSDSQLAWSDDWIDWYVTKRPVDSGTEAGFYYCYDNPQYSYGCLDLMILPWRTDGGTAFKKSFYSDSTENSYLLVGTNLLDSSLSRSDHFWCAVNGDQTNPSSLVGFDKNTNEKYNLKADISTKVKPGMNTITCWVSSFADPNPYQGGYKKFDMSFVQTPEKPEIIGLTDYNIPIDDPTVTALVSGSGNTTVYAELLKGTRPIDKTEADIILTDTGTVKLTLDILKDSATLSNNNIWKYYVVNHLNPAPSSDWYKIDFNAELWEDVNMPTAAGGGPVFLRKIFYLEMPIDLKLKAWDGYAGYCFINENRVDGQNIQIGQYLRAGENVIACSIWGPGRDGIIATFYGEPTPPPNYTILSNSLGDWFIVNSTESSILSLIGPGKYSVKITVVYNEHGISKTKDYNLEFTEPVPEYVPVNNPFVQSGGGGSESSDTNSSGSVPIVPLAVGLTGAAAIGAGYLATRPNKRYGKPSLGPGERLKTFWENTGKDEKYYNEVRVPEIRKRQAEIEAIIKGFEEQARKKKEQEELEKIAEKVAWLNKLAGAGKLSTIEVSKELRVLAGTAGIGYENYTTLSNASKEFETSLTVDTNKKDSPLDSAYKALTSFTDWAGSGLNWGFDQIRDFIGWLFYSGKDFGDFGLDLLSSMPFIGGILEEFIRTPYNFLEDNVRNLRNYIAGDSERLNGIADKLSIGGLGLIGVATAGIMFHMPLLPFLGVPGAAMLLAGAAIDVSTWLSNESVRKADGWARLRGILGALTFLPEIGGAGKVGSAGKIIIKFGEVGKGVKVAEEAIDAGNVIKKTLQIFADAISTGKYILKNPSGKEIDTIRELFSKYGSLSIDQNDALKILRAGGIDTLRDTLKYLSQLKLVKQIDIMVPFLTEQQAIGFRNAIKELKGAEKMVIDLESRGINGNGLERAFVENLDKFPDWKGIQAAYYKGEIYIHTKSLQKFSDKMFGLMYHESAHAFTMLKDDILRSIVGDELLMRHPDALNEAHDLFTINVIRAWDKAKYNKYLKDFKEVAKGRLREAFKSIISKGKADFEDLMSLEREFKSLDRNKIDMESFIAEWVIVNGKDGMKIMDDIIRSAADFDLKDIIKRLNKIKELANRYAKIDEVSV